MTLITNFKVSGFQIFTILTLLFYGLQGHSQSPDKFSYQAVVHNENGGLASNTLVNATVSLLQGSANGSEVFSEFHSVTTNTNGLLSIEIGGGGFIMGSLDQVDWAMGPFFIKTEMELSGSSGDSLIGINQLMSVPYALYAANAPKGDPGNDGVDGKSAYQIWLDQGNMGTESDFLTSLEGTGNDTDTQLNETQVDAFVANNGYITSQTDDQAISYNATTNSVTLEDGGTIDLSALNNSGSDDQAISFNTTTKILTLEDGGTVDLTSLMDNTDTQLDEIQVDAFVANNGYITSQTDDQAISYNATTNVVTLEDGGTIDLSALNNSGSDDQAISFNPTTKILALEDGGTVDLTSLMDNTDTQLDEIQVDAFVANNGYITSQSDDQAISYNATTNVVTLEDGGTVDLNSLMDDTHIDSAGVVGLGFTPGAHTVDTQVDSTGIATYGFVAGNHTPADNLGNHIATQNIQLGTNWLSGDGGDEGIYVDSLGHVGIGTNLPDSSSVLDLSSSDKGLLIPRMPTSLRDAIGSPATGLEIYNTTTNLFNFYDGSSWKVIESKSRDKHVLIKSAADFPAPSGGAITLDPDFIYEINGSIVLSNSINLNGAVVYGIDGFGDKLIYMGGGALFTGTEGGSVRNLFITTPGAQAFNMSDASKTKIILIKNNIFYGCMKAGTIDGYTVVYLFSNGYSLNGDGFTFSNTDHLLVNNQYFFRDNSGTMIDLAAGSTFNFIEILGGFFDVTSSTGLNIGASALVTNGALVQTNFHGTGTRISGTVGKEWEIVSHGVDEQTDDVASGTIYVTDSTTTNIPAVNTPIKIAGTTASANLFRVTSSVDNRLTYEGTKTRNFIINCVLSLTASSKGKRFNFYIAKNGVIMQETVQRVRIDRHTDVQVIGLSGVVKLAPNDYIEVWIENTDDASDVMVQAMNLSIL